MYLNLNTIIEHYYTHIVLILRQFENTKNLYLQYFL